MSATPMRRSRRTVSAVAATTGAALVLGLGTLPALAAQLPQAPEAPSGVWTPPAADETFHRLATYPVFKNVPAGVDPADPTVAEISAVSEDGKTFIHTDALAHRIGFVDITDPGNPTGIGTLDLDTDLGLSNASPTSVTVIGGYVLVVVDTSDYASSDTATNRSGVLVVVDLATHEEVTRIDLGGQPDSIAVTPDKKHAAIAMENQRDEEGDVDPGVMPEGFLQIIDTSSTDPSDWEAKPVELTPDAVYQAAADELAVPTDPEPEYVSINPAGTKIALTLQENNGVVIVDVATGTIEKVWSAGTDSIEGIDTDDDGTIDQTGSITDVKREPDSIGWIDDEHVATANEGDWEGGTRGWTIFDLDGTVVWDAGATMEELAVRTGLHNEDRAGKKGPEMEGLAVEEYNGTRYAFVGSERSNFVAVYDVTDVDSPRFVQILATTNGPEGILPVPSRDLLLVSSEEDDASVLVRSSVSVFGLGDAFKADAGTPEFPTVVSADWAAGPQAGKPIGWSALGALSADPADPTHLWSATDAVASPTQLLSLDISSEPVVIDESLTLTQDDEPVGMDVEGISARADGGFWLGVEGATGDGNKIVQTDAAGAVVKSVPLPTNVAAGLSKWGLEGVAVQEATEDAGEQVWVAVQRGLTTDEGGLGGSARVGRYDVDSDTWDWFGYTLQTTTAAGDWLGLSEIVAIDHDSFAVIERDKLNGPSAKVKAVYAFDVPETAVGASSDTVTPLTKVLAHDVLPDLQATKGWTQEKLEGLTIGADGNVYASTDNDGLADATGETVLLRLGAASTMFADFLDEEPGDGGENPGDGENPGGENPGGETPGAGETAPSTPLHTVGADDLTDANHGGLTLSPSTVKAGETVTVTAGGFQAGEWVLSTVFSTPEDLGMARANADGTITTTVTIPADLVAGAHRFAVVGQVDGRSLWTELTVLAADGTDGSGDNDGDSDPVAGADDGDLATTGAEAGAITLLALLLVGGGVAVLVSRRRLRGIPR